MTAPDVASRGRRVSATASEKGVTEDELLRAKQPILTSLKESARTNGYWLGNVLGRAQEKPEVLDWCRSRFADFEAVTKPELDALAKQYLGEARRCRFLIEPVVPVTTAEAKPAETK